LVVLSLVACDRHLEGFLPPDDPGQVCTDIAFCEGHNDAFIQACRDQAADLRTQAQMSGCAQLFDSYYECANDHYDCRGDVPVFPSCDDALARLKSCLAAGAAHNACGQLDQQLAACPGAVSDGNVPPPCIGGSVCVAQCYLTSIMNVCAPRSDELTAFTQCAQMCRL
jgi:hypothetical protein